jgi:hypothetical protein
MRGRITGTRLVILALVAATAYDCGADSPGAPTLTAATRRFATFGEGVDTDARTGLEPDRFATVGDGVVLDSETGLEWTSRDHLRSLTWHDADRYCRELLQGQRAGWRLPEIGELQLLYDKRADQGCGYRRCRLDPAVSLADPYVWSASSASPGVPTYMDFSSGTRLSPGPAVPRRVICVRQGSS